VALGLSAPQPGASARIDTLFALLCLSVVVKAEEHLDAVPDQIQGHNCPECKKSDP
jgi:hypothetical protein